jgi:hypothetical protein
MSGLEVGAGAGDSDLGVLKAPVLCFCSFSKISCSSFGRRGGAGLVLNEVARGRHVLKARRERRRGKRLRFCAAIVMIFVCM